MKKAILAIAVILLPSLVFSQANYWWMFDNKLRANVPVYFRSPITAVTTDTTLTVTDSGGTSTNAGASASVTITCPQCTTDTYGWTHEFIMQETGQTFYVDFNAADQAYGMYETSAAGDKIQLEAWVGAKLIVECTSSGMYTYGVEDNTDAN